MTNLDFMVYTEILVIAVITITIIIPIMNNSRKNNVGNNKKKNAVISAKEIVDRFSISYQTVNYYTDFGLLQVVYKRGNERFYNKNEVKHRLAKITKLAGEGYSLRLIRRKLIGW